MALGKAFEITLNNIKKSISEKFLPYFNDVADKSFKVLEAKDKETASQVLQDLKKTIFSEPEIKKPISWADRAKEFFFAKPATDYVQENFPEIVFSKKRIKMLGFDAAAITRKVGNDIFYGIPEEDKLFVSKIMQIPDKLRSIGEGIYDPSYMFKWGDKNYSTVDDFINFYKENLPKLSAQQRQIITEFKKLSDEIGRFETMAQGRTLEDLENTIIAKIKKVSGDETLRKLEDLRDFTSKELGIDFSFWNLYYPHIHEWKVTITEKNIEYLKMMFPDKLKNIKATWERSRRGLESPIIEDPEFVYKTTLYNFTWLKKYREVLNNTLDNLDFFKALTPEEFNRFFENIGDKLDVLITDRLLAEKYLPEDILKKWKERYPNEKNFVIYHQTKPFSSQTKINDQDVQNLFELIFGDDIAVKKLKDMGIEKKIYMIPETVFNEIKNLHQDVFGVSGIPKELKNFVSYWKTLVTVGTRFLPFRLNNSIGDIFSLAMKQPGALSKIIDGFRLALNISLGKELPKSVKIPLGMSQDDFANLLRQSGVLQTFATEEMGAYGYGIFERLEGKKEEGIFGIFKNMLDVINSTAELTPKISSILHNLQRVDNGLLPEFTGAEKYILNFIKKDPENMIPAIFERGATITVDYSNIPAKYKRVMTEFLAPFSYWYVRTMDSLGGMLFGAMPKVENAYVANGRIRWALFGAAPIIATYLWNTSSPERKKVWEGLPTYLKYGPLTVIAGIDKKSKTPIVFSFYTPAQMVSDFLGEDKALENFEKYKSGQFTAKEAVIDWILGAPINVAKKYMSLLNPIINGFISASSNQDLFTGTQIVPDNLKGTKFESRLLFNYIARQTILSPIVPMMASAGARTPEEMIQGMFGSNGKLAKEFLQEYAGNFGLTALTGDFSDILKGVGMIPEERMKLYMSNAATEKYRQLNAQRNEFLEETYKNYLSYFLTKDSYYLKQLQKQIRDINSGAVNYVSMNDINNYFNRPSVIRRFLNDVARRKLGKEEREKIIQINNYLRSLELGEKTAPKSLREEIKDYQRSLNEYLYGD
jgi:hypothetical protein